MDQDRGNARGHDARWRLAGRVRTTVAAFAVCASGLMVMLAATLASATVTAKAAKWTAQTTFAPARPRESALTGVSCISAAWCVAVGIVDGGYSKARGSVLGPFGSFAESWDGSRWRLAPRPGLAGAGPGLYAVSCTSPTFCVAVGYTHSDGLLDFGRSGYVSRSSRALVEMWNGASWTAHSNPGAALVGSGLFGVSCTSTRSCVAVGSHTRGKYSNKVLTEVWNGTGWRITPTPRVARYGSSLQAVSCIAADVCTAVGSYNTDKRLQVAQMVPLAERWNGSRWTVQRPPPELRRYHGKVYANYTQLTGVSCLSRSFCLASGVAERAQAGDNNGAFAVRWTGTRWVTANTGRPYHSPFWGVACRSSSDCVATGQFDNSVFPAPGSTAPLAERWDGSRWDRITLPRVGTPSGATRQFPDGLDPALFAVSCVLHTGCIAVGDQAHGNDAATLAQSDIRTPAA